MPTALTRAICDGEVSFEDFVLACAQAVVPDNYHSEALAKAIRERDEAEAWTPEQVALMAQLEYEKRSEECEIANRVTVERRVRLGVMLKKVEGWEPPTSEHNDLKLLMVGQLENAIKSDCKDLETFELMSDADFKQSRLEALKKPIEYHGQMQKDHAEKAQIRQEWIRELRESLQGQLDENV